MMREGGAPGMEDRDDADAGAQVLGVALGTAFRLFGMARPCLSNDAHVVETLVASQLDKKMWSKAFAAQDLLFDLRWKHIDATHDDHVIGTACDFLHPTH